MSESPLVRPCASGDATNEAANAPCTLGAAPGSVQHALKASHRAPVFEKVISCFVRALRRKPTSTLGVVAWLALSGGAFAAITKHGAQAGTTADAPRAWPERSAIVRAAGKSTVVLLAHPLCPCTRASLRELDRLSAKLGSGVDVWVVFRGGRGIDDAGSLPFDPRAMARAIPGAHLLEDPGGVESIRFGATTSGQVVAYDPTGRLVFTGGLTASRGHEGESDGARLLETRLRESPSTVAEIRRAVFGCGLFSSTEKDR